MGGPKGGAAPKGGKNAALVPKELSAADARQLLQFVGSGHSLSDEQRLLLARLDHSPCAGQCGRNDKSNASCFSGLVPAEGSFKKKGLWKKQPDCLGKLGGNPEDAKRQVCAGRCARSLAPPLLSAGRPPRRAG